MAPPYLTPKILSTRLHISLLRNALPTSHMLDWLLGPIVGCKYPPRPAVRQCTTGCACHYSASWPKGPPRTLGSVWTLLCYPPRSGAAQSKAKVSLFYSWLAIPQLWRPYRWPHVAPLLFNPTFPFGALHFQTGRHPAGTETLITIFLLAWRPWHNLSCLNHYTPKLGHSPISLPWAAIISHLQSRSGVSGCVRSYCFYVSAHNGKYLDI